jgi:hypothetical protein
LAVRFLDSRAETDPPTVGRALREAVLPRPWWLCFFPVAVLLHSQLYWIRSFLTERQLPLAVRVMFRPGGDPQYFPLIRALGRLNLGEPVLAESYGRGAGAFPYASLSLHGLTCALFGAAGFPVADGLAALLYFAVLGAFLRLAGIPRVWAAVTAGLVATGVVTGLWIQLIGTAGLLPGATYPFYWGNRLPRPLVSETLALLVAAVAIRLAGTPARSLSVRAWAGAGAALAVLLQADFHAAVTFGTLLAVLLAAALVERRRLDATAIRAPGAFLLGLLLAGWPFVVQQLLVHPDVPRRLGAFVVSRARPLWDPGIELPRFWNLLAMTGLTCLIVPALPCGPGEGRAVRRLLAAAGAAVIAFFALPLSCVLLGRTIQPYHFVDRWQRISGYALLALGLWLGRGLLFLIRTRWTGAWPPCLFARAFTPAVVLAALLGMGRQLVREYAVPLPSTAPRTDFARYAAIPAYKERFAELCRELAGDRHRRARTLATLDHHVFVYWTAFAGRFAAVPDPFSTFAPDRELEDRLLSFLDLLGVPPDRLATILTEPSTLIFFLSHDKYQASRAHHFAPLAAYPDDVQRSIRSSSIYASWQVALPRAELDRLVRRAGELASARRTEPDLIVLGPPELSAGLLPPSDRYRLDFRNDAFQLWSRL